MDVSEAGGDSLAQTYLERARELKPMLAAAGDKTEAAREVAPEIVNAMIERGIFRMLLPRSIGGAELDPLTYTAVLEILAQGDGSPAWCLGQNSGCSMTAPYLSHEMAREIFGGPRGILAWGPEIPGAGQCVAVPGGYRATGRWGFATGSRHASWIGAHCPVFEKDGSLRMGANGRQVTRTMLVPKSEVDDHRQLARAGAARHRQRQLRTEGPFCAGSAHRDARQRRGATRAGAALPVHLGHDLRDELFARVSRHRARRLRRVHRDRARQDPARRQGYAAREQRDPGAGFAIRGEAEIGARLSSRRHRRDVGRGAAPPAKSPPSTTRNCACPRPGRSTRRATSWRRSITRPAPRRFSRTTRWSAACATSTPAPSRARAAPSISKPSARC